jgi:hypothetical protein
VVPEQEGQDACAGDQWSVPELWLSAGVGVDSRKTAAERVDWYKEIIREILGKDRMLFLDDDVF